MLYAGAERLEPLILAVVQHHDKVCAAGRVFRADVHRARRTCFKQYMLLYPDSFYVHGEPPPEAFGGAHASGC